MSARLAVLAAFLASILAPARAVASCGAENCPLDNFSWDGTRRWSLEVSYQQLRQDRLRIGTHGADASDLLVGGGEVLTRSRTTTTKLTVPLPARLQFSASLPVVDRVHRHVTAEGLPQPELREWQYHGLGDLTLLANWTAIPRVLAAPISLSLQGGVKLPTGRRHIPEIDGEELEPHARPGSGSTDLLGGLSVVGQLPLPSWAGPGRPTSVFASMFYMHTGHGTEGTRIGRSLETHVGASHPLPGRLNLVAQINVRTHGKDHVAGPAVPGDGGHHNAPSAPGGPGGAASPQSVHPGKAAKTPLHEALPGDDPDTGGTSVFASPGLRFEALPGVALSGYIQIPLYQRVNGTQLVSGPQLYLGATYRLR